MTPEWRARSPVIALFAKAPQPGQVKTRLCPPLTPEAAAALQRACLQDLWHRLGRLQGVHRIVCFDPPGARGVFLNLLGPEVDLLPQSRGDLGHRLWQTFRTLFSRGWSPILVIGADSPDLPLAILGRAIARLAAGECDVALGPAEDGGYTLIGLREPHPEPFEAIPWSTPEVLETTRAHCRQAGLRVLTLPVWYDVDDAATLDRLQTSVFSCGEELPRLCEWFAGWKREESDG